MNLLLICSDQHRASAVGPEGEIPVSTPVLDSLCEDGAVFENAYTNAPLCVPSRMSFLTGLLPSACEVLDNTDVLDSRRTTFAHLLSGGGYRTVLAGRMHFLGPDQHHGYTERLTGDVFPYALYSTLNKPYAPLAGRLGNGSSSEPVKISGSGSTNRIDFDRAVTRDACDWLRNYGSSGSSSPFMMTVGYWNPHPPYIAPGDFYSKYAESTRSFRHIEPELLHPFIRARRNQIDASGLPMEIKLRTFRAYCGLVSFIDHQVGELLNTLDNAGLSENTAVIYFSDHGEMLGDYGIWAKNCFYDPAVKVPFIVRMPGNYRKSSGVRITDIVSLLDLFPTLLDLAGVSWNGKYQGDSLAPLFSGDSLPARPVISEYYPNGSGRSCRMIRRGRWKLNVYGSYETGELYDLESDPEERVNLAGDPGLGSVESSLERELYRDGWTAGTDGLVRGKLAEKGYTEMRRRMISGIKPEDYPESIPGFWHPITGSENYLD
ncbi:MAG: sulfatase-like hydrolase/transferase [Spirochaetia bacterium]